jgi:hypothetical protein
MTQYDPFAEQPFIGNEYLSSHQNVRDVINPSTLQPCGRIADATPAEIDRALSCAEATIGGTPIPLTFAIPTRIRTQSHHN